MSLARTPRIAVASLAALLVAIACGRDEAAVADSSLAEAQPMREEAANRAPGRPGIGGVGAGGSVARGRVSASDARKISGQAVSEAPPIAPAPPPVPAALTAPSATTAGSAQPATPAPPMLIRTGAASIEVDSLEPAIARINAMATQLGGYVANTMVQTGRGELRSAHIEVRVPSARFDEAVSILRPLGKVESFNVGTQDVGEEYVDVTARMQNAERLEQRLVTLLATRTGKLEDVLAVERELARVREEIERYEGRLRFLRTQTSFSTLAINVHEPAPVLEPRVGPSPIAGAFRQAWRNFVGLVAGVIASLGVVIPLAVIVGLLVWLWRRFGPRPAPVVGVPRTPGTPGAPPAPPAPPPPTTPGDRRDAA